jgi:hypothetical protein
MPLLGSGREIEPGSAAIERAAAELRGSWVLNGFKRFTNPTAERRWGFCLPQLPDGFNNKTFRYA